MFDLIIRNGTVVDGTGSARFKADVAIKGDSVVAVGDVQGEAAREIDATGKVVTPGFIDLHTHSDNSFLIDPLADSKLTQGVTFELMGNCGMSYCAPLLSDQNVTGFKERTDKYDPNYQPTWSTMDGYLTALEESGSTINIAAQVGHGTVRGAVMGMFSSRASLARALGPAPAGLLFDQSIAAPFLVAGACLIMPGKVRITVLVMATQVAKRWPPARTNQQTLY